LLADLRFLLADLNSPDHQRAIVQMLDAYARDPMGAGQPLPEDVYERLIPGLRELPTSLVFLAFRGERPVGIAVCFRGFSTFAGRALINIHDFSIVPEERGRGVGRRLIQAVEDHARSLGCCKLTLEVQEKNLRAQRLYESCGFAQALRHTPGGGALFYDKRF